MKWYFISTLGFFASSAISFFLSRSIILRISPSVHFSFTSMVCIILFICLFIRMFVKFYFQSICVLSIFFSLSCLIVFVLFLKIIHHSIRWKCWFSWPRSLVFVPLTTLLVLLHFVSFHFQKKHFLYPFFSSSIFFYAVTICWSI